MFRRRPRQPPRLWPAGVVLALAGAALAWGLTLSPAPAGLSRGAFAFRVGLLAGVLLLAWWLLFSRTRLLTRLAVALGLVALLGTLNAFFEIRGFTEELVPQVAWRWSRREPPAPAPAPAPRPTP
jgi:hypothetical protein